MSHYQYQSLPPISDDESDIYIRLVELPVGDEIGEVSCTMTPCRLSQAPEFEAVSYCWGDPMDVTGIKCDGKLLHIPRNLNDFLLRTRAIGRKRTLWIDSISINQGDSLEKASQVGAMRHIYRRAARTLIWLGKEADDSTAAIEFAGRLGRAYINHVYPSELKIKWSDKWKHYVETSIMFGGYKWNAFFLLLERPWWQRSWVVQEVAVASETQVICGPKSIDWVILAAAMLQVSTNQIWIAEFYGSVVSNNIFTIELSRQDVANGTQIPHYQALARYRHSRATDPRDKVFAFYGLSGHDSLKRDNIIPNYELSASSLYKELAKSALTTDNLDFLSMSRLSRETNGLDLPSWVPDWDCSHLDPNRMTCISLLHIEYSELPEDRAKIPQNTTKGSKFTPIISEDGLRLEVSGYTLDRIVAVSKPWTLQETIGFQTIRKQALILQENRALFHDWETLNYSSPDGKYLTGESLKEVFWQVAVAGYFDKEKEETRRAFLRFEKRHRILRLIRKVNLHEVLWVWMLVVVIGHILRLLGFSNPEIEFRVMITPIANRRLAKTEKGYIGLVPGISRPGDEIVLLKGGKLPFVVRPVRENWELIGDCYIHGITDGEVWDETKCEPIFLV